jgi:hypothetical protein
MSEVLKLLDNLSDTECRHINLIIKRYVKAYKKHFGKDLSYLMPDIFAIMGHVHLKDWQFDLVQMKNCGLVKARAKDKRLFLYDMSGLQKNFDWDRLKLRQYFSCFATDKKGPLSIHPLEKLTRVPALMRPQLKESNHG